MPIDDLAIAKTIHTQAAPNALAGKVDIVRDKLGIPHIYAATERDAAFGNGWIQAHDRLVQMHVFRLIASGRISEQFGQLQPDVIEQDIKHRTHRIRKVAEDSYAILAASTDPTDKAIVEMLTGYSDGVNAFVEAQRRREFVLDEAIDMWFDISKWEPWTPVDTLALGRLQQFSLAFDDFELDFTRNRERWGEVFDTAADGTPEKLRAGGFADLFNPTPMDKVPTMDGWPNVATDTGSRAFGLSSPAALAAKAPVVGVKLLDQLIASRGNGVLSRAGNWGLGSNNWVVSGSKTASGRPLLANDTHLPLLSPSIWYQIHIVVPPSEGKPGLNVFGEAFPGVPGVLLGMNQHVAWGATVAVHDVTDVYKEEIVPCAAGGGDCVKWKGQEVAIEKRTESFKIGAVGTTISTKEFTFEWVPHHGPILPIIEVTGSNNYNVKPRTPGAGTAVSIAFTGHTASQEVRFLFKLNRAKSRAEAFAAMKDFTFGAFNWVLIDTAGDIAWTTAAKVPRRPAAAMTFHRKTNRAGTAPFLVQSGDGSADWTGFLDPRYIPHGINPLSGYFVTANSDPIGETFDGDPLNGPMVDGAPLFVSATYDVGYRTGRISRMLDAKIGANQKLTLEDMERMQADAHSNVGEAWRPYLASARMRLDEEIATPGTHPNLAAYALAVKADAPRLARLRAALDRIAAWTLDTPPAINGTPTQQEIDDSVATMIFNTWFVKVVNRAIGDELEKIGRGPQLQLAERALNSMLAAPADLVTANHPTTSESALWDDLRTPAVVEGKDQILLGAMEEATSFLAGAVVDGGFDSSDMTTWRWGKLHRLKMDSLVVPNDSLDLPPARETDPNSKGGFPRHGENHTVDVANFGIDTDFTYSDGAARRFVCEPLEGGGGFKARNALPGGQIHNPQDPHYRDLLDQYWLQNKAYDLAYKDTDVVLAADARWVLER